MVALSQEDNPQSELPTSCSNSDANLTPEQKYYEAIIVSLSEERQKQGLSLHALADRIGCNLDLVAKWEARIRRPSAFLLYCWAESLDMIIEVKKRGKEAPSQRCANRA